MTTHASIIAERNHIIRIGISHGCKFPNEPMAWTVSLTYHLRSPTKGEHGWSDNEEKRWDRQGMSMYEASELLSEIMQMIEDVEASYEEEQCQELEMN